MSRSSISTEGKRRLLDVESDIAWIWLLTITPPGQDPVYLARNLEPITSRGNEFIPYAFDVLMPEEDGETMPNARIVVDNVHPDLIRLLRKMTGAADILLELIAHPDPDRVEVQVRGMKLYTIEWNVFQITGIISVQDLLGAGFPGDIYSPREYQGLF